VTQTTEKVLASTARHIAHGCRAHKLLAILALAAVFRGAVKPA
jgi:hypothetical protein